MQKNLALIAKYFKKIYKPTNNNLRTSSNSKNKNVDTTLRFKNGNQSGQFRNQRMVNVVAVRENVGSKIDEQELEAHYSYMARIQEVPNADSVTDSEPVEQVQNNAEYNVFSNKPQHSEQSESVSNTCLVETDDSNITPDSPDMCKDDIQNEQNDVESDGERVALANLIANLKLDVDENKKIQKQLKKANTTLAQELKECKTILAKTSKSPRESISVRDSCLVALQTKQAEFEKYKAINDRTVDYDKLERVTHKPNVSKPQLKRNQSIDKVLPNNSQVEVKKTQVEVHPRIPSVLNKMKSVTAYQDSLNSRTLNANAVCATCNKRLINSNHFACVTKMLNDVHARTKKPTVVPISTRKPKSQVKKSIATPNKKKIVQLIQFIVDSGCTKHITGNLKLLYNFVEKFLGTVRFGNDQFAPIIGYGDLVQGNVRINRVYYVEGLNHNLFSVGQFCDANLEATPTQAWLRHRRLSHLNFDYINLLSKKDIVIVLPKLNPLKEEVYVAQPDGFVDPDHPEKVYRLRKALYRLKQAPRAWYDELSKFLTSKGFTKVTIDLTLFTIRYGEDILPVQIYAKYTLEILHKHGMDKYQSIGTPMAMKPKLDADLSGNPIDQTDYRSKIGSLMYLTSSRPDIVQAVCFCARYQSQPNKKHIKEVKRIFRYLRDADHAGCIDSRKSTSGGIQFLGDKLVSWMSKKQNCTAMSSAEAEYMALFASYAQVMWMRT
nr:hypothetical protein [Tanacetum cinerariifolium]